MEITNKVRGRIRIANNAVEGYVVYVGENQMPDFTQGPDGFSATRPVSVSITPPPSGTTNFWVVMRKRNAYGVESQNQKVLVITVNSDGNEELGALSAPIGLQMTCVENEAFLVYARYPGFYQDTNPGDTWKVYVKKGSAPVPGTDEPVVTGGIASGVMQVLVGAYPDGNATYYGAVTVYRTADGEESEAATTELVLSADPAIPIPVNSGWVEYED